MRHKRFLGRTLHHGRRVTMATTLAMVTVRTPEIMYKYYNHKYLRGPGSYEPHSGYQRPTTRQPNFQKLRSTTDL